MALANVTALEILNKLLLDFHVSEAFVVYPYAHFNLISLSEEISIPLGWELFEKPFFIQSPEESWFVDSHFVNVEESFMSIDNERPTSEFTVYSLSFHFLSGAICDKLSDYTFYISARDIHGNNDTLEYPFRGFSAASSCSSYSRLKCPSTASIMQILPDDRYESWADLEADVETCKCRTHGVSLQSLPPCIRPWPHIDLIHHYILPLYREIKVSIYRIIESQHSNRQEVVGISLKLANGTYLWNMDESSPFSLVPPHIGSYSESNSFWSSSGRGHFQNHIQLRLFSNLTLDLTEAELTFQILYLGPPRLFAEVRNRRCDITRGAVMIPQTAIFSLDSVSIQCEITCTCESHCTAYQVSGKRCEMFFRCDEDALVFDPDSWVRFKKYKFLYEEFGAITMPRQTFYPTQAPSRGPDPTCVSRYLHTEISTSPRQYAIDVVDNAPSLFECMHICCNFDLHYCTSFIYSMHTCFLYTSHFDLHTMSSNQGSARNYTWYRKIEEDYVLDSSSSRTHWESLLLQVWAAFILVLFLPVCIYCFYGYFDRRHNVEIFEVSESVDRGADSEQLNALVTVTYSKKKRSSFECTVIDGDSDNLADCKRGPLGSYTRDSLDHDAMCVICTDPFVQDEKITHLPCAHKFHMLCLMQWLRLRSTCPLCRLDIKYVE